MYKKLHKFHNDLTFLSERMELGKVEKLVTNLNDKNEYINTGIHFNNKKDNQKLNDGGK